MDISVLAGILGTEVEIEEPAPVAEEPILLDDGTVAPATAPVGIKPPKWWKGNQAAFDSSVTAMGQVANMPGSFGDGGGGP
jgi:hypothetical protein